MELFEKTVGQQTIYKGKIINLRVDKAELPNGRACTREVIEHPGAVTIAPLTEDNELIFVRQFRYPLGEAILELPAGKLEPGEDPFEAGKRELREEAGAVASKYMYLGKYYPSPAYCEEIIHFYGAFDLTFTEQELDEDEFLNIEKIPLERAAEMVMNNEISDGKTQALVLKLYWLVKNGISEVVYL